MEPCRLLVTAPRASVASRGMHALLAALPLHLLQPSILADLNHSLLECSGPCQWAASVYFGACRRACLLLHVHLVAVHITTERCSWWKQPSAAKGMPTMVLRPTQPSAAIGQLIAAAPGLLTDPLALPAAMTTMTTVGYGDITAVTVAEQLVRCSRVLLCTSHLLLVVQTMRMWMELT